MSEMEHERRRDELAAFLLGALEPGEAADLEQHLAGCGDCRDELERLRPAVLALPDSVERREAPRRLRDRVMAEVRDEAKAPPAARDRRWAAISLRPALGFAAALLVAFAVVAYTLGDGDSGEKTSTVVAGEPPGVTVKMVRDGDSGTLRLAHLRELPPDRALQAWVRRGGRVEAAGSPFPRRADGTATATIGDMRGVEAVMVTAEPRGGASQPTSAPLINISVRQ